MYSGESGPLLGRVSAVLRPALADTREGDEASARGGDVTGSNDVSDDSSDNGKARLGKRSDDDGKNFGFIALMEEKQALNLAKHTADSGNAECSGHFVHLVNFYQC